MTPNELRLAIERFLAGCRQPALHEAGQQLLTLSPDSYVLEETPARLTLQAWDDHRNFVRRITGVASEQRGRLELAVELFARKAGSILLLDLARPANHGMDRRGTRLVFREQVRRFLSRHFTDWKIAALTSELDLHNTFSPTYPRAMITQGTAAWAVIGAPPEAADPGEALSFGLIWLDYLRRREKKLGFEGLILYLPLDGAVQTCLRLRHMNPAAARFDVYTYGGDAFDDRLDPRDWGNLDTRLDACNAPGAAPQQIAEPAVESLRRMPDVDAIDHIDGSISFRVRGLEFARWTGRELLTGIETKSRAGASEITGLPRLVRELSRMRSARAADRANPLYTSHPEAWLESHARRSLRTIDASLLERPVYGQVPAFAGGERGVIDLLAVGQNGRLAVVELKASEDLHLPLQALDYWMRVAWHANRGEFGPKGYFPGVALRNTPPKLVLAAPAMAFHPSTETILRYFAKGIEVERVGLAVEWQEKLDVVFRYRGAEKP